jgi:hypothetical protein
MRPLTPFDPVAKSQLWSLWSLDAVAARLLHLRGKASYVQKLILEDVIEEGRDEPKHFPDCILPDLIATLKGANKVSSIMVTCRRGGTLPLVLWEWMTTKNLTNLIVGPQLAPPPNAQMHHRVQNFEGFLHEETMPFLDLIRPDTIKLRYFCTFYDEQPPPISSYKPSGPHNSHLRKIVLNVTFPPRFNVPLFDFSGVPDAKIEARFHVGGTGDWDVPDAWKRLKRLLRMAFTEGLDGYDVSRPEPDYASVYRPPLTEIEDGWKPTSAVHLEGAEVEREEAERMQSTFMGAWDRLTFRRVIIRDV